MARDIIINGETLVYVKSGQDTQLANRAELGLAVDQVRITFNFRHLDVKVDAWGGSDGPPVDVQWMLADAIIQMTLVHYDHEVLSHCLHQAMAANAVFGDSPNTFAAFNRAGIRLGNNTARFATGYRFIGLNLASPQLNKPWRFKHCYLANQPATIPLGVERSLVPLTWRAIPYTQDPWNGGAGANAYELYDHVLDT